MDHDADAGRTWATDELTAVLLDRLSPALDTYRREAARYAGLGLDGLVCIEWLRRWRTLAASSLGDALVITRSGLSKTLRRLEAAGQIDRDVPDRTGQEVHVAWRPVESRDVALEELRARVHSDVAALVVAYRLDDPQRHALVAWWTVQLADLFARHARRLADEVEWTRVLERRRRQRAAMPDPWRGR